MDNSLKSLLVLRELDERIMRLSRKLKDRPAALGLRKREVEAAEAQLKETKDQTSALQQIVDRRNVELRAAEDMVKKMTSQLDTLKTNEEYQTMQRQIEAKKATITEIEDRVLEGMEVVEKAQKNRPAREAALKESQAELAAAEKAMKAEVAAKTAERESLLAQWEEKSKQADPAMLKEYLASKHRHEGNPMVLVSPEGSCGGCHTKVTSQILNIALAGRPVSCNNCYRLIYSE